jgi:hypothetical protein
VAFRVGEFGLFVGFGFHDWNPTMTVEDTEIGLCRSWCEVCAEYLYDREAFRKSLKDDLCVVVGGTVLGSSDFSLRGDDDVQDLHLTENVLRNEGLDESR